MTEILIATEWKDRLKARAVPGSTWSADDKGWVIEDPSARAAAVALKMFPGLATAHPELLELRDSLTKDIRPIDNATEFAQPIGAHRVRDILEANGKAFYDYQAVDLGYLAAILAAHGGAYNGWEMGLGKTLGACAIIDELECKRTLIVCPNTAKYSVWRDELEKWCPWLDVVVIGNTKSARAADLATLKQMEQAGRSVVLVCHYDALKIIAEEIGPKSVNGWDKIGEWDLVVADEVHRIANTKALMTRALKKIPTKMKLGMSGTAVQNRAEELYSPLNWLFPDRYKSKWRDWNDRYLDFVENGYGKTCIGIKLEMVEQMREELGVFMVMRRKTDVLNLPPLIENTRYIELSPAQRKAYDELAEQSFTTLESGETYAALDGLSLLGRLRQVATGLSLIDGSVSDSSKLDIAVEMVLDNPDEAFLVFSWYKAAAHELQDRLEAKGVETYLITGDAPQKQRAEYIAEFQGGSKRVLIGTISSLGESVNLQRANNAIFLDQSWNPAHNKQARDRIFRMGQEKTVLVTTIVAKDTVDELRVMPVLADKKKLVEAIFGP